MSTSENSSNTTESRDEISIPETSSQRSETVEKSNPISPNEVNMDKQIVTPINVNEESSDIVEENKTDIVENTGTNTDTPKEMKITEKIEIETDLPGETSIIEKTDADSKTQVPNPIEKTSKEKNAQQQLDEAVAEDSEDEARLERHQIEKKDYSKMIKEDLIKEITHLVKTQKSTSN